MKIIAFGYKKQTGKNTAAKLLTTALKLNCRGVKIKQISFAGKLKDICYQLYGWTGLQPGEYYERRPELKEVWLNGWDTTPRQIWIDVGNSLREVYLNTWVHAALTETDHDFGIVTDLRFWNEAVVLRTRGAMLLKMFRDAPRADDPAEVDLDCWNDWDMPVYNDGTMNELNDKMVKLAEKLCQKNQ